MPATLDLSDPATLAHAQEGFLEALPRIREHAEIKFRGIRDPGRRDDAVATAVGLGWKHWLAVLAKGDDPSEFVSTIADYSVKQVRSGRRLYHQERPRDVLSDRARRLHGFAVEPLPATSRSHEAIYSDPHGQDRADAVDARLADNASTPPPEQAAFRERYAMMLGGMSDRKRAIVSDLAGGEDTQDVAARHAVSPGRVSQVRREAESWWRERERKDIEPHEIRSR